MHVIEEVHQHWQNLVKQEDPVDGIIWYANILYLKKYSSYVKHS